MPSIIQPNFAAGEIAPSLWGRVDLAKLHAGVALARNFFVDYHGGLSNRSGTMYVGRCVSGSPINRLIRFQFSTIQGYALLFGNLTLRVIKDGALVLETPISITAISNASPGVVSAANTYTNGDEVNIVGATGLTGLNNRNFYVQNVSSASFTLTDLWGNAVDTTAMGTYTGGATVARVYSVASPYASSDLALLKYTQNADVMTLTHPSYAPCELTRSGDAAWTFTALTFASTVTAPGAPTVTASNTSGTTHYNYVITAIGSNGITESLPSAPGSSTNSAAMSQTPGAVQTISWTNVSGNNGYNIYRQGEVINGSQPAQALFGFVGTVNTNGTSFVDQNISPDFTQCPPQGNNPFASGNNPGCSTYYQGRQVYGGMANDPVGLAFSQSGDYQNMDYSSPSRDSDSIQVDLNSVEVNAVKHLLPMQSLIVLTASGAWKVDGGGLYSTLTPTSIQATPQAFVGSSDVPPLMINYDILYVQAKQSIVRDLSYNFYVNIYTGSDISVLASHLLRGHQITEWAWAREPSKVVWSVREDGIALSLTYMKDQEIFGWARHDTTNGLFKSVCSVSEGQEDAVYFVVERLINGQYVQYVERMASRNMQSDPSIGIPADLNLAWFVDAGLRYPQPAPPAALTPTLTDLFLNQETGLYEASGQIGTPEVVVGGAGYTAPTVTIADPTGSGAAISLTVSGGVVTTATLVAPGTGYTNPVFTVNDTTGAGAVVSAPLVHPAHFNTGGRAVFGSNAPGDVLRTAGGGGPIVSVVSATEIEIDLQRGIDSLWPAASGTWTLTTPTQVVTGLDHLDGETVSILADGSVQAPRVVSEGSITLDNACSSIVVGEPITGQLQSLYLDAGEPTIQGKRKQIAAVTVRVMDTRGLQIGPTFDDLVPFRERSTQLPGQPIMPITGDERIPIPSTWSETGQICLEQTDPLPATVTAFIPEVQVGDTDT